MMAVMAISIMATAPNETVPVFLLAPSCLLCPELGTERAAGHQPAQFRIAQRGPTLPEEKRFPAATIEALRARDHDMSSGLQAIQRAGNNLSVGADPRCKGLVVGD